MTSKQCFIKTSDETTAASLRESGLTCIGKENDKFVFVCDNNQVVKFAKDNTCIVSHKLCF